MAHLVAREGMRIGENQYWVEDAPLCALQAADEDRRRLVPPWICLSGHSVRRENFTILFLSMFWLPTGLSIVLLMISGWSNAGRLVFLLIFLFASVLAKPIVLL